MTQNNRTVPLNALSFDARPMRTSQLAGVRVGVLGELQLVIASHALVRHFMHEVYKAFRADSAELLFDDYTRTVKQKAANKSDDDGDGGGGGADDGGNDLWIAAARGARPTVERIIATVTGVDVDSVENRGRSTALHIASQVGWTDVVKVRKDLSSCST